jgi:hypothetical protein
MTAALQALQDQYDLLTNSLPDLLEACHGDAGKMDAINTQYAASEANYRKCINKIFNDNDPSVQTLVAQMKKDQTALTAAVAHIGEIAKVITAITTAVQTGTSLAAKV